MVQFTMMYSANWFQLLNVLNGWKSSLFQWKLLRNNSSCVMFCRLFTVPYFPVRLSGSSALSTRKQQRFFLRFHKSSHPHVFKSFCRIQTKTPERRKYDSVPHKSCVYDVWHHRVRKPTFLSVHTKTTIRRLLKNLHYEDRAFVMTENSVYMWTQ